MSSALRRECWSCAAISADGARFPKRKARGQPLICADCAAEAVRVPLFIGPDVRQRPAFRRAQYRAEMRHRAAAAQLDLVDLIVGAP